MCSVLEVIVAISFLCFSPLGDALFGQLGFASPLGANPSQVRNGPQTSARPPITGTKPVLDPDQIKVDLNLPTNLVRLASNRAILDEYIQKAHAVEEVAGPTPTRPLPRRRATNQFLRFLHPTVAAPIASYRISPEKVPAPLPGFRAAILDEASEARAITFQPSSATKAQRAAAEIISQRLARDGLLATLARVIEALGPGLFRTNHSAAIQELWSVGFPVDWLAHFQIPGGDPRDPHRVLSAIARKLSEGEISGSLPSFLNSAIFRFHKSSPDFRIATESGEYEIGMVRIQLGGGYDKGILPGDSIDVAEQLVTALPDADFVMTVPEEFADPMAWMAQYCWPLKRRHQVTMITAPSEITPWAQDNGKAGLIGSEKLANLRLATLTPRFASQGDAKPVFMPGDSYLMDGLRESGHQVIHSPLLFQGGNLLAVQDPVTGRRIMLAGEAVVYRNAALGLTRDQVLEALRVEFGVDACVIVPMASYHLDFDLSIRSSQGRLIAFVNDRMAAVRLILKCGIDAMEKHGSLNAAAAQAARECLTTRKDDQLCRTLRDAVQRTVDKQGRLPASLARNFGSNKSDSPAGNLQCFLVALDLLAAAILPGNELPAGELAQSYFGALRTLVSAKRSQTELLKKLGFHVVPVPSMPELYRSINYLNGIHGRTRYIMPAFGGFYASVDQAASKALQQALGAEVRIVPIYCAALQRNHGAVHCAASAYPRLEPRIF